MKNKPVKDQDTQINLAVKVLQQGGVIAYPTEAVYGLGCDPKDLSAIKKILELKQREKKKGLILVAANFGQLKPYLQSLDKELEEKLVNGWCERSTALTWLVPVKENISESLRGQFNTLAVRVSKHPIVKELCEKFDGAIISTSANISTEEAARTSHQVKDIFENKIDFIVDGITDCNVQPSEIRDALTDEIIRK